MHKVVGGREAGVSCRYMLLCNQTSRLEIQSVCGGCVYVCVRVGIRVGVGGEGEEDGGVGVGVGVGSNMVSSDTRRKVLSVLSTLSHCASQEGTSSEVEESPAEGRGVNSKSKNVLEAGLPVVQVTAVEDFRRSA